MNQCIRNVIYFLLFIIFVLCVYIYCCISLSFFCHEKKKGIIRAVCNKIILSGICTQSGHPIENVFFSPPCTHHRVPKMCDTISGLLTIVIKNYQPCNYSSLI